MQYNRDSCRKFIRYLFTGGAAAVVDIAGFGFLRYLMVPVTLAAAGSFFAATAVNFFLSAQWVFGVPATPLRFARFLVGTLVGLTLNVVVTVLCTNRLGLPWVGAKAFAIMAVFALNFWVNATIVFRKEPYRHALQRGTKPFL